MFDKNPKVTPADVFVAGRTTEAIVRAILDKSAPDGTLQALVDRFDRKADRRATKVA